MWLYTFVLLAMAAFGLSDLFDMPSAALSSPICTLTYTATQPPQIGPTSTIYKAIMTTFIYAVDCNVCTVTNTPSALIQGAFTTKSYSSMLTITEVRCIPTGTASTRQFDAAHGNVAVKSPETMAWDHLKGFGGSGIYRRDGQNTDTALSDQLTSFVNDLPDSSLLSGALQKEFSDIASALYALSLCDSGLNLTQVCSQLGTSQAKLDLILEWYDADNIQSIVCFCASYGYTFDTTRQQLYASLWTALIGIVAAADVGSDRGQICDNLSLFNRTAPSLGIDVVQFHSLVCNNIPFATPLVPTWYGSPSTFATISNNMSTWVVPTTWLPNTTISGTGIPTSWANTTFPGSGWGSSTTIPGIGMHTVWTPNITIPSTEVPPTWTPNTTIPSTGFPTTWTSNITIPSTGWPTFETPNITIQSTEFPTARTPNITIPSTGFPTAETQNVSITETGLPTGWTSPNITISGTTTPTPWSANTTDSGTGSGDVDPTWTSNGTNSGSNIWGPPISYTGTIRPEWSITIHSRTDSTQSEPTSTVFDTNVPTDSVTDVPTDTATDSPSDTVTDFPTETDSDVPDETDTDTDLPTETNTDIPDETDTDIPIDTGLGARKPRGPNARAFYPANATPTARLGLFKRY